MCRPIPRTKLDYRLGSALWWLLVVEVGGLRGSYDNTHIARPGQAEYHSLGTVFIIIIMAIICPCKGFHSRLSRLSAEEGNCTSTQPGRRKKNPGKPV